jgi:hypothetical protein
VNSKNHRGERLRDGKVEGAKREMLVANEKFDVCIVGMGLEGF